MIANRSVGNHGPGLAMNRYSLEHACMVGCRVPEAIGQGAIGDNFMRSWGCRSFWPTPPRAHEIVIGCTLVDTLFGHMASCHVGGCRDDLGFRLQPLVAFVCCCLTLYFQICFSGGRANLCRSVPPYPLHPKGSRHPEAADRRAGLGRPRAHQRRRRREEPLRRGPQRGWQRDGRPCAGHLAPELRRPRRRRW